MAWLAKNVGGSLGNLGNLASRIAAEANGENGGNNEAIQLLTKELEETREELNERHQEWERVRQNYEEQIRNLTTDNRAEQLEQKLRQAANHLKSTIGENKELIAKNKALQQEKEAAEAAARAATEAAEIATAETEAARSQHEISRQSLSDGSTHNDTLNSEKTQQLEAELKAEKEQHAAFAQSVDSQISALKEVNEDLKSQLKSYQEEADARLDLSIQLEMAKEELEQAKEEIQSLKEDNSKTSKSVPSSPVQQSNTHAIAKELAEARSTIAKLEAKLLKESNNTEEILKQSSETQKNLENTIASLRDELEKVNESHLEIQSKLSSSKEINDTLEKSKASDKELVAKLTSELNELKLSEAESKKNITEQFESERNALLTSHDNFKRELDELKAKLQEAQEIVPPKQTDEAELTEKFESEKAALIVVQENLKQEIEALKKSYDEQLHTSEETLKIREATIHNLESTVSSHVQELGTVRGKLEKVTSDYNILRDRVSNMKSTLGPKLQADLQSIPAFKQEIEQLTAQNNSYLQTIDQLKEELMASHEHYEKTSRELEHLRRHMDVVKEEAFGEVLDKENLIQELQSRLQREEREREDWETMASEQRASKDQAVMSMRAMERERDAARAEKETIRMELSRQMESLSNLQSVLEEFQSTKESEIQFVLEGLQKELKTTSISLEEYKGRAHAAEEQLHYVAMDAEKARQLEREVKEKNQQIGKLRHEAVIQQGHLTEAMRRLKEESNQNTVDIPLISNLFIRFLQIERGDQKKFEILQLISGVLNFTDEQREQAGLIKKGGALGSMTPSTSGSRSPSMEQMRQHQEPKESFFDLWVSYLVRESNANSASNNSNSPS